jgi:hypothetical protein
MLTLDILGKLDLFGGVFDLSKYYKHRWNLIGLVMGYRENNIMFQEIYNEMIERHFKAPFSSVLYSWFVRSWPVRLAARMKRSLVTLIEKLHEKG